MPNGMGPDAEVAPVLGTAVLATAFPAAALIAAAFSAAALLAVALTTYATNVVAAMAGAGRRQVDTRTPTGGALATAVSASTTIVTTTGTTTGCTRATIDARAADAPATTTAAPTGAASTSAADAAAGAARIASGAVVNCGTVAVDAHAPARGAAAVLTLQRGARRGAPGGRPEAGRTLTIRVRGGGDPGGAVDLVDDSAPGKQRDATGGVSFLRPLPWTPPDDAMDHVEAHSTRPQYLLHDARREGARPAGDRNGARCGTRAGGAHERVPRGALRTHGTYGTYGTYGTLALENRVIVPLCTPQSGWSIIKCAAVSALSRLQSLPGGDRPIGGLQLSHSSGVEWRDADEMIRLKTGRRSNRGNPNRPEAMRGVGQGGNPTGIDQMLAIRSALMQCGTPGCAALVTRGAATRAARSAGRISFAAADGCAAGCTAAGRAKHRGGRYSLQQHAAHQLGYAADVLQGIRPVLRRQGVFDGEQDATLVGSDDAEVAANAAVAASLPHLPDDVIEAATTSPPPPPPHGVLDGAAELTAEEVDVLEQLTADEFAAIMALETGSEMPPSAPARDSIDRADTVLPRARLPPRGSRKRPLATEGPLRATWQRYPGNHPPPLPPRPPPTPQQSAELEASNRSLCEVAMELAARRLHELAASVAMPHRPQAPPLLHQPAPPSPPLSPPSLPRPHACSSTPTSTATTSSSRTARVTGL